MGTPKAPISREGRYFYRVADKLNILSRERAEREGFDVYDFPIQGITSERSPWGPVEGIMTDEIFVTGTSNRGPLGRDKHEKRTTELYIRAKGAQPGNIIQWQIEIGEITIPRGKGTKSVFHVLHTLPDISAINEETARIAGVTWLQEHPDILIEQGTIYDPTNLDDLQQYERRVTERETRYPNDYRPI